MQPPKYKFFRVNLSDKEMCKTIMWMHKKCFPDDEVLEPTEGYWWVVKLDKELVGFCAMRRTIRWSDCGYLWRAAVMRCHRGKGLQRRMIRIRERLAKKLGWNYMISDTNDNPQSANNLIKTGYLMYQPGWPYGAETACYWKKKL